MQAKISRILPDIPLPAYKTAEAAGFDIAAGETMTIAPGKIGLVRTGLVIEAPQGHFLLLTGRSSLALKKGLALSNGVGTIDRDYAGPNDEIFIQLLNIGESDCTIEKGERLVNGIFLPIEQVQWVEQDSIRSQDRGGHGSTGGYAA